MEILENNLTVVSFFVAIIFIAILISTIAFVETKSKAKQLFYDEQDNLIVTALILFIGTFAILWYLKANEPKLYGSYVFVSFVLVTKIGIASYVSSKAKELGRNRVLWWILSFLEFHVALIVLSQSYKLLNLQKSPKSKANELNRSVINRLSAIKKSAKNGIISESIEIQKISKLRVEYRNELQIIITEDKTNIQNDKLEYAFKNGVISEQEYLRKKQI